MILIFLGTMFSATISLLTTSGLVAVTVVSGVISLSIFLWIKTGQRPGKRNGLAHMLQAADPRDGPLNSHAKPGMRNAAIFAQIQIPLEGLFRQMVFPDALQQQIIIANALRSANNFAVSFGGKHVHTQGQLRTLRIRLHVKRFHFWGIAEH